jgi:hypothetical protein
VLEYLTKGDIMSDKIEITSIKAFQSSTKAGWFLINQYSKDPVTGKEIDLGVACGWPLKKGFKLSRETFVTIYKEYNLDEQMLNKLKTISKHIKNLKIKEQTIMRDYLAEVSKGISDADLNKLSVIQNNYNFIIEEIETAVFFSDSILKALDNTNIKKTK